MLFDPLGLRLILSRGGRSVPSTVCPPEDNALQWTIQGMDNPWGGQSGEWTLHGVDNPRGKRRVVKPWVDETTIHRSIVVPIHVLGTCFVVQYG